MNASEIAGARMNQGRRRWLLPDTHRSSRSYKFSRSAWRPVVTFVTVLVCAAVASGADARSGDNALRPEIIQIGAYEFSFAFVDDSIIIFEPIWLRVSVRNVSDSTVPKPQLVVYGPVVKATWVDPEGVLGCMTKPRFYPNTGNEFYGVLAPGDESVHYSGLGYYIWHPMALDSSRCWFERADLTLVLRLAEGVFPTLGDGNADSVLLPLVITPPKPPERLAIEHIIRAMNSDETEAWMEELRTVFRATENSGLAEHTFELLLLREGDPQRLFDLSMDFARRFPNSPALINAGFRLRLSGSDENYLKLRALVESKGTRLPMLESTMSTATGEDFK